MKDNYINILLDVNNYFGKSEKKMGSNVKFLASSLLASILILVLLSGLLGIIVRLIIAALVVARLALLFLFEENKKLAEYIKSKEVDYQSVSELNRIKFSSEDGVVDYTNGLRAIFISIENATQVDDYKYSKDLEEVLDAFNKYDTTIIGFQGFRDVAAMDGKSNLRLYTSKDFIKERKDYYDYLEEFRDNNSKHHSNIVSVFATAGQFKNLMREVETLTKKQFDSIKNIHRLNKAEIDAAISRDFLAYLDLSILESMVDESKVYDYGESSVIKYGGE